ncbi:MAG: hypothetical protein ISS28_01100 [Candidatus Cloacimonetes bacterium]|nr:hypothetical protein [Candidatus Cloacimonadota bacterium]
MNAKIVKLIKRYCKVTDPSDLRPNSTTINPVKVIKQKLKKLKGQDKLNFIKKMKEDIIKYEK